MLPEKFQEVEQVVAHESKNFLKKSKKLFWVAANKVLMLIANIRNGVELDAEETHINHRPAVTELPEAAMS